MVDGFRLRHTSEKMKPTKSPAAMKPWENMTVQS